MNDMKNDRALTEEDVPYDLTVVTVCWNALSLLPKCIDSVQPLYEEKRLRVEYLLVDGASTDGTVAYLETQLREGRITRYVSEPDNGLYDAMNKAISLAKGRVIVFINADDEICPAAVYACCEPILQDRADYVLSSAQLVDEEGMVINVRKPDEKLFLLVLPCCHQAAYCSADLLRKMNGFAAERYRLAADAELFARIYTSGARYEIVDVESCRYFIGGLSASSNTDKELVDIWCRNTHAVQKRCAEVSGYAVEVISMIHKLVRRCLRKGASVSSDWQELMSAVAKCLSSQERRQIVSKWRRKHLLYTLLHLVFRNKRALLEAGLYKQAISLL